MACGMFNGTALGFSKKVVVPKISISDKYFSSFGVFFNERQPLLNIFAETNGNLQKFAVKLTSNPQFNCFVENTSFSVSKSVNFKENDFCIMASSEHFLFGDLLGFDGELAIEVEYKNITATVMFFIQHDKSQWFFVDSGCYVVTPDRKQFYIHLSAKEIL